MVVLAALFFLGLATGTIGALLGLGGGVLLVPALTLFFHLPVRTAIGTSLVGIIAVSAGVAVSAPRERSGDVPLALRLEMATTAGAIAGSLLAGLISETLLELLFAGVVFFTAIYVYQKARHMASQKEGQSEELFRKDYHPKHWLLGMSMAGFAGALSGLLGVSGGFIKVPTLDSIMEVPLGIATATSSIMVGITAAASVFIYYSRGDVHPFVAVPVALGVFLGASLGVRLLPRARVLWLRSAMVILLLLLGVQMLVRTISA